MSEGLAKKHTAMRPLTLLCIETVLDNDAAVDDWTVADYERLAECVRTSRARIMTRNQDQRMGEIRAGLLAMKDMAPHADMIERIQAGKGQLVDHYVVVDERRYEWFNAGLFAISLVVKTYDPDVSSTVSCRVAKDSDSFISLVPSNVRAFLLALRRPHLDLLNTCPRL